MHIGMFIKKYRDDNKISMAEFAKMSGISKAYVSVLEKNKDPRNGKEIIPSIPVIKKVSNAINISFDELLESLDENQVISFKETETEKDFSTPTPKVLHIDRELHEPRHAEWVSQGERLLDEQISEENSVNIVADNVVQFPKLYRYNYYDQPASAGTGQYLNDVQVEQIKLPVDINAEFVVPIYGDSMEPDYSSGDYIFVKPSVNLSNGDIGVFEYNGDAYIKQLIINKHDAFLRSLNDKYDDIPIDKNSDFRIIGEVVGKYSEK